MHNGSYSDSVGWLEGDGGVVPLAGRRRAILFEEAFQHNSFRIVEQCSFCLALPGARL